MGNISDSIKKQPFWLKILVILVIASLFLWIIFKFFPKVDDNNDNDKYIIENTKLRTQLEILIKEKEDSKKIIDSLKNKYDSTDTNKESEKITKIYENEKNRISTIPIDSTVINLSKWLSESPSNK